MQKSTAFNSYLTDEQFRTDYAETLSKLFSYVDVKIKPLSSRRLLADTDIIVNSKSLSDLQTLI